ncbi:hypothetical protein GCM10011408_27880 [Dyella caseinilytica]|nr:hypothetical protein GCM10011408_27880 [Dyella caseinilytica]
MRIRKNMTRISPQFFVAIMSMGVIRTAQERGKHVSEFVDCGRADRGVADDWLRHIT